MTNCVVVTLTDELLISAQCLFQILCFMQLCFSYYIFLFVLLLNFGNLFYVDFGLHFLWLFVQDGLTPLDL